MAFRRIDCRLSERYPVHLKVSFAPARKTDQRVDPGTGCTLNISTTGVLFESDNLVPLGNKLNLHIDLPSAGQDPKGQIAMTGTVVRISGNQIAVRCDTSNIRSITKEVESLRGKKKRCILCIEGSAPKVWRLLRKHSFQVLRMTGTDAFWIARVPEADIQLIVTDQIPTDRLNEFSGMCVPIVWIDAPENALEMIPNEMLSAVKILRRDCPPDARLRALDLIIRSYQNSESVGRQLQS